MPDKYFGKYSGLVVDNMDPEQLGQLRVSVPAIFPEDELMLARPALPYGIFFVPEVGTKVWVEFEGGDTGLPIWTGVQSVGIPEEKSRKPLSSTPPINFTFGISGNSGNFTHGMLSSCITAHLPKRLRSVAVPAPRRAR